jgi:hypothetical protein
MFIEGLVIGLFCGAGVPVGLGVIGTRYLSRHPEIIGKFLARKMMTAVKKPTETRQ